MASARISRNRQDSSRPWSREEFPLVASNTLQFVTRRKGGDRLLPRIWDHQWHHLVNLRRSLLEVLNQQGLPEDGQRVVDVGCGDCPYEPIFRGRNCEYIACDFDGDVDV